jgi:hypothetical protein
MLNKQMESLRDARQQEDMERERQIHHKNFHSASGKEFTTIYFVEHVVMKASIIEVVERALVELFGSASTGIQTQVMFIQDLRKMRKIVFLRVSFKIFENVVDAGRCSPMIEGL